MADGKIEIDLEVKDTKAAQQGKKAGDQIAKGVEQGVKSVGKTADNAAKSTEKSFKNAASSAKSSFSDVGSSAKNSFGDIGDAAKTAADDASSAFKNVPADAAGAFGDVGSQAQAGFDGVADAASTASSDAASQFESIPADAAGSFQDVGDAARNGFDGIADAANNAAGNAAGAFDQVADAAATVGDEVEETLGVKTIAAGNLAADAIETAASKILEIGQNAINSGMDFDKSMSQVAATMGITTDEIGELTEFAKHMGETTAFSAAQSADALNYMALAGYDASTSMQMLPTVLNLAAAGNMDLATASDMVTDAQSALGLTLEETSEMVDKMAKASSKSNTSVEQLGSAFLTVGGTAKNLKNGTTEAATALGILADNGVKGSEGGTALRNVILSLSAPTDKAAGAIQDLGIQVFDAEGNMRGLDDIFRQFDDSMSSLTQQEKTEALNNIFNKVDLKSVTALMANANGEISSMGKALEETGFDFEHVASKSMTEFGTATGTATDMAILIQETMNELGDDIEGVAGIVADDFNISIDEARSLVETAAGAAGDSGDRFEELAGYINDAAGSAQKMADTQLDNLAGDVTLLESATEGFYIAVSDALNPALRSLTQFGTNSLLPFLTDAVKNFDKWSPALLAAGAAIAVMVGRAKGAKILNSLFGKLKIEVDGVTKSFKYMTAAEKASAIASEGLSKAMKALKTAAPILIFTALVEVGTLLFDKWKEGKERAEKLASATDGLSSAASGATIKFNEETGAIKSYGDAIERIDIDDMIQKHIDLAKSLSDTAQEAATSQGLLSEYERTIGELAGSTKLSEEKVAELNVAVNGINDALGTSYSVIQDDAGAYQIMADGVAVAKEEIFKLIDAQKLQLQTEADMRGFEDVYAQLSEDNEKLAKAKKNVADISERMRDIEDQLNSPHDIAKTEELEGAYAELERQLEDSNKDLEEAQSIVNSSQSAYNKYTEKVKLNEMAAQDNASAVVKAAAANLEFRTAVQGTDTDLVGFTQALEDMGYTSDQVANMSQDDAMKLAIAWRDGTTDLINNTNEVTKQVPEALRQMGDDAYNETYASGEKSGQGLQDGLSEKSQDIVDTASGIVGSADGELDTLDDKALVRGGEAGIAFATALGDKEGEAKKAGEKDATAGYRGLNSIDGTPAGLEDGTQYASGVGSAEGASRSAGETDAKAAKEGLQSENRNAETWGFDLGQLFSDGLRAAQDLVSGAANFLAGIVANILGHSVPKEGILRNGGQGEKPWGEHLVQNIADGMTGRKAQRAIREATKAVAVDINDSLLREMNGIDPMAQLEESLAKGSAAFSMSAMMVGAAPSYTNNNQTVNFNGDITSPDIIARNMRMQQHYGLAGRY